MIIAGSIVGSGELIATTKVGAEAGFWLLWLIIVGCVIKVFTQVEIGRYTVTHYETALAALNDVPGPRLKVNWLLWYWLVMMVLIISQLGGIVGGVGQAMAIWQPLTAQGKQYNEAQNAWVEKQVELAKLYKQHPELREQGVTLKRMIDLYAKSHVELPDNATPEDKQAKLLAQADHQKLTLKRRTMLNDQAGDFETQEVSVMVARSALNDVGEPYDAIIWATIIAIATSIMLYIGRYGFIQGVSTFLVGAFTATTVFTVVMLQSKPEWAISGSEFAQGLQFRLPPVIEGLSEKPLATALAAFGIIGVGAAELIMYPYWCLEKGYARSTGRNDGTEAWAKRAKGWMRVMYVDAWCSMVVYTFATLAFYMLGAAVLGRTGLNPAGGDLIRTLAEMYVPVFGTWAPAVFLFGAFAVLYSTYFVASAGNARIVADAFGLFGITANTEASRTKLTRIISAAFPILCLIVFVFVKAPAAMVLASGLAQALMLPMLGLAALWFRYRRCDPNLKPNTLWDVMLWLSFGAFLLTGGWIVYTKLFT
ncbi:MAG: transmembrane Mn(2+) transporter [Phycisphaera sp.]|nr:transmembrane Mn(2+) transporter [Phycisphaera sp.]